MKAIEVIKNKSGYALNVEQILDGLIIQFVTLVIVKKKKSKKKKSIGWEDTIFLGDLNTIKVQVLEETLLKKVYQKQVELENTRYLTLM